MPNYILEAKKRLGMIKQPHIAPNIEPKKHQQTDQTETSQTVVENSNHNNDAKKTQKHWQMWDNPSTPDKIKEIRARLGDDRYRKLQRSKTSLSAYETKLENYINSNNTVNPTSQRPKTSFEIKTETAPENGTTHVTTTITVNENEAAAIAQALEPYQIPTINDMEKKSYVNTNVSYNPPMPTSGHLPLSAVSTNYFDLPNPSIIHTTATTLPSFSEPYDNYVQPQSFSISQKVNSNPEVSALQTVYDNDNFMVNNENQVVSDRSNDENENDYYTVVPNNNNNNVKEKTFVKHFEKKNAYFKNIILESSR